MASSLKIGVSSSRASESVVGASAPVPALESGEIDFIMHVVRYRAWSLSEIEPVEADSTEEARTRSRPAAAD